MRSIAITFAHFQKLCNLTSSLTLSITCFSLALFRKGMLKTNDTQSAPRFILCSYCFCENLSLASQRHVKDSLSRNRFNLTDNLPNPAEENEHAFKEPNHSIKTKITRTEFGKEKSAKRRRNRRNEISLARRSLRLSSETPRFRSHSG